MEREYIGMDLHKQFFQACADADAARGCGRRAAADRRRRSRRSARAVSTAHAIAVEATGPTWAFVDALRRRGRGSAWSTRARRS